MKFYLVVREYLDDVQNQRTFEHLEDAKEWIRNLHVPRRKDYNVYECIVGEEIPFAPVWFLDLDRM